MPARTTRARRGDGARYKEKKTGLWAVAIELPPTRWNDDGTPVRNRKVQRFRTRAEADTALRDLREQKHRMGTLPGTSPTVRVWFDKWLRVHVAPRKRPRTADTYRTYVNQYIVPALRPETRLSAVTPDHVRRIESYILDKGLSPTTARNAYHYATKALETAIREGLILNNPASRVEPPLSAVPDLDVFSLQDALKLIAYLDGHPDEALWMTYLYTAARRGEIAGLEVDRVGEVIDLSWQLQRLAYTHGCVPPCGKKRAGNCPDRKLVKPNDYEIRPVSGGLHLTRPKSRAGKRLIPLVEPLRTILLRHMAGMKPNPWGLLFASEHGRYGTVTPPDPDRITKEWPRLRDEVFGPGRRVRLHDIRHTTVDLLYLAGVPEDLIQEVVGHSTRAMTRAYKSPSDLLRLTEGMNRLSGILSPEVIRTLELDQ